MKYKVPEAVRRIVRSPYSTMATGFILLASGIFESTETALEKFFDMEIKSYMGIIFFATVQILKAITDIIEGLEKLEVAELEEK